MKKNRMMRVASALLVAVLLTTCCISGTFAKYATTFTGTDTAKVAKWDVEVEDANVSTKSFTFNILKTIVDADTGDERGQTDNDVLAERLAPGTKGSFTIEIKNRSEVTAEYNVSLSYAQNLPITFEIVEVADKTITMGGTKTITVNWEWPFESNLGNEVDMSLAGTDLTVTAEVIVTQVD